MRQPRTMENADMQQGIFTIENTKTEEFRTFELKQMSEEGNFAPGKQVLSLLIGPSNSKNYQGFAFLDGEKVSVWKRHKSESSQLSQFEKLAKLLSLVLGQSEGNYDVGHYRILEAVNCRRCGELLTVPKSISAGIGPVCAQKEL